MRLLVVAALLMLAAAGPALAAGMGGGMAGGMGGAGVSGAYYYAVPQWQNAPPRSDATNNSRPSNQSVTAPAGGNPQTARDPDR